MIDIIVDVQFETMIPPLTTEERHTLEVSLLAEGCRDALVVWDETGILLDGHNRKAICEEHEIPFRIHRISLPDRAAAEDWIDANQMGRRNLKPKQARLLRGRRYERAKSRQGAPEGNQNAAKQTPQNEGIDSRGTAERLAEEHGVSRATIERDGEFARAVDKLGIGPQIMRGEIDASCGKVIRAAKPLNNESSPEQIEEARELLLTGNLTPAEQPAFNRVREADVITAWLERRRNSWPDDWKPQFVPLLEKIVAVMACQVADEPELMEA